MPFFVDVFWLCLLLLDARKLNLSKRFLVFFLSLSALNYIVHAAFFNHQYQIYAVLDSVWVFTSLAGYPLYYYYIRLLTTDSTIKWRWLWVLAPSLVLAIYSAVIYILMTAQDLDTFIHGIMYGKGGYGPPYTLLVRLQVLRLYLFKVVFAVQVVVSMFFGIRLIRRYNRKIKDFYSNIGGKDLSQVKWVFFAFVFASLVSTASNVVGKDFFVNSSWLIAIPSLTHSMFLFFIGYVGYRQDFTVAHFEHDVLEYEKHEKTTRIKTSASRTSEAIRDKLNWLLSEEKVFKNPDLRITDVCQMIGTNRTYLSNIVNSTMNTNFCDLVNKHRVTYAMELIKETNATPLTQVSEQSGFSSLPSFYRAFKKETGVSPGEWRRSLAKGD